MIDKTKAVFKKFIQKRNKLDIFLLKGALMAFIYFVFRILFKTTPVFHSLFVFSKKLLITILVNGSNLILKTLGYSSKIHENVIYIEGSNGVRVINACLGWAIMALFVGFIIAYPGTKKSKLTIIPLGILAIVFANMLRISLMAIISYIAYEQLDFYHRYIFNFILYAVVIGIWIYWIRKNKKAEKSSLIDNNVNQN
jgi:exosortase/archaeosortase family protein